MLVEGTRRLQMVALGKSVDYVRQLQAMADASHTTYCTKVGDTLLHIFSRVIIYDALIIIVCRSLMANYVLQ